MKDIVTFINESNVEIFDPNESEIYCDSKKLVGAIYDKDMKIIDHAESYEEALTMIERDCTDDDKLYFIHKNSTHNYWETSTVTFYWKKGKGDKILISSDGDEKTKEQLKTNFDHGDILVVVNK